MSHATPLGQLITIIEHLKRRDFSQSGFFQGLRISSPESTVKSIAKLKLSEVQLKVMWMHSLAQPGRISLQRAGSSSESAKAVLLAAETPAPRTKISVVTIAFYLRKDAKEAPARRGRTIAGADALAAALPLTFPTEAICALFRRVVITLHSAQAATP
jgi:hypothetical protein